MRSKFLRGGGPGDEAAVAGAGPDTAEREPAPAGSGKHKLAHAHTVLGTTEYERGFPLLGGTSAAAAFCCRPTSAPVPPARQ